MEKLDIYAHMHFESMPSPLEVEKRKLMPGGDDFFRPGTMVGRRWEIKAKLGSQQSNVYKVYDAEMGCEAVLKADLTTITWIKRESIILNSAEKRDHFCQLIHKHLNPSPKPGLSFLVMTLLGPSIAELRSKCEQFTLSTTLLIGSQILSAISFLHNLGYIHRNIEPRNLLLGLPPMHRQIYLIDFSTTKRYLLDGDKGHCDPREGKLESRGSIVYASPNAHEGKELSRRDDLWSLLYTILACRTILPWSRMSHHNMIYNQKKISTSKLIDRYLTPEFEYVKQHLESLNYYKQPNYAELMLNFFGAMKNYNVHVYDKYDWEKEEVPKVDEPVERILAKPQRRIRKQRSRLSRNDSEDSLSSKETIYEVKLRQVSWAAAQSAASKRNKKQSEKQ